MNKPLLLCFVNVEIILKCVSTNTTSMVDWAMHLSYYKFVFVSSCSADTIQWCIHMGIEYFFVSLGIEIW
jgi:hypothetical protein